ncbi:MAG: GIY-YIG nuclease family protein [Actinobacteria bacterium]|nr:GIY-YIG nuclease family protein [Actinomycetota bacterium]
MQLLKLKWVESCVVYIGKGKNLSRRLKQYAQFGSGKPTPHWGGRYVWQLRDAESLLVAWKQVATPDAAASAEASLLAAFRRAHGGRPPFANLVQPRSLRVAAGAGLGSSGEMERSGSSMPGGESRAQHPRHQPFLPEQREKRLE